MVYSPHVVKLTSDAPARARLNEFWNPGISASIILGWR